VRCCKVSVLVIFVWLFISCGSPKFRSGTNTNKSYLVVLSLDGFRWDYPEMYQTPNFDSLARTGVKAKSLIPCFPSKTFPNHYSIATGLYPEHHGIVLNTFTDPEAGDYKLSDRNAVENPAFYLGEPIWVTAENQNVRTACFYWPGSEAPVKGIYADTWKKYDANVPFGSRIDSVISWLEKPAAQRPHLVMAYFDEPDHTGHAHGPFAPKTRNVVVRMDSLVGVFRRKLNRLDIADSINFVVISDHGMGQITTDKSIALADYLKEEWVDKIRGGNPVVMLKPFDNYRDTVRRALSGIPHLKVYSRTSMPAEFHYNRSNRILDHVCVADSGYAVYWDRSNFTDGGTHGYDPSNTDMHAIFYGSGPAFKTNFESSESIRNIDLYSLFSEILGVRPAENDGSLSGVLPFLVDQKDFD